MLSLFPDVPQTNPPAPPAEPYGTMRDDAIAGDGTGTPTQVNMTQDLYGGHYAVLEAAGINPSSIVDNAVTSDFYTALTLLINGSHADLPLTGSTPIILTPDAVNTTFEVDLTAGTGLDVTLPLSTMWPNDGDYIKFRIVGADANETRRLRIIGSGGENISSLSSHDFYFVNSWVTIKKFNNSLQIDCFEDAKSLIFKSYFTTLQNQITPDNTTVIYPTIDTNKGGFYNSGTGIATIKIPGDWTFNYSIYSQTVTSSAVDIYSFITPPASSGNDGYGKFNYTNNRTPYAGKVFDYTTESITDTIQIRVESIGNVQGGTTNNGTVIKPGFSGKLIKRFV